MDKPLFNSALPMTNIQKIRQIKINEPVLDQVDSCTVSSAVSKSSPIKWNPVQNPAPVLKPLRTYGRKTNLSREIPDLSVGSESASRAVSQSPGPSTSAFADIERMIDEPEWERFRQDLASSDFERIKVATQEPEAFSDEENNFLVCGSGTKNVGKRKRSENSLRDRPDSSSPRQKSKRIKTETEQSMETCEPEEDNDSNNLALTPNGNNLCSCRANIDRLTFDSNPSTVCFANRDVSKRIKQEPEQSSVLQCSVTENRERGTIESVQDSVVNGRVSSIVFENHSLKQESEPLMECAVPDDGALVSSSEESKCAPVESVESVLAQSFSVQLEKQKSPVKDFVQTTNLRRGNSAESSVNEDSDPTFSTTEVDLEAHPSSDFEQDLVMTAESISPDAEPEEDRNSENLALTPNGLNLRKCFVRIERLAFPFNLNGVVETTDFRHGKSVENSDNEDSYPTSSTEEVELEAEGPVTSYLVSASDFEPDLVLTVESAAPDPELEEHISPTKGFAQTTDFRPRKSVEKSVAKDSDTTSITKEVEPDSSVRDFSVSSSAVELDLEMTVESVAPYPGSDDCNSLAAEVMSTVSELNSEQDGLVANKAMDAVSPSSKQAESVADGSNARTAPLSNVQMKFVEVDSFPNGSDQDGTRADGSIAKDPIPASKPSENCVTNDIVLGDNANSSLSKDPVILESNLSANSSVLALKPQRQSLLQTKPVVDDPVPASEQADSCIVKDTAPIDSTRDPVTLLPTALNIESTEITAGTEVSQCSVAASCLEQDGPEALQAELHPVQKTTNGPEELASAPVLHSAKNLPSTKKRRKSFHRKSILSYDSDIIKDVRRSSRSKPAKVSYKEDSDHDESSLKVLSEDGDSSDEDFDPDNQHSEDDEVEITKSRSLSDSDEDFPTDEQLLDEVIECMKSTPLFKPFRESKLETMAPEVVKHWKAEISYQRHRLKSVITSYIRREPKYFNMLKTYVYDGIDEDAIRSLPTSLHFGAQHIHLRVKCPVCCKILTVRLFHHHMDIHADNRPHKCEKCGKGYLSELDLIAHERESKCSGTPFTCKVCGKPYECKSGLCRHEKSHDLNKKKYKCHVCDAVFALPRYFREHVVRHTNPEDPSQLAKLFQCDVCGKHFATKRLMNGHKSRIHLKNWWQPRECKTCNAKFKNSYQYHNHVLLHNKGSEKPFKCPHCDKRFSIKRVLRNHIMTHTGEKPHKCDICGHAFTQKVALNKHRFTHQGRKPYRCDKCGKDSQRKQDIIEHKCPMDKSVTKEGDNDPVPAPKLNKAKKLSSTKKRKRVSLSKSNVSDESEKIKDVRRSSRSKPEKVSYKEHSDDDESSLKVSSEDGDSSDEDFEPDEQLSDGEVGNDEVDDSEVENDEVENGEVEAAKSMKLSAPSAVES